MSVSIDIKKEETRAELMGSLLAFTRFFYQHVTGRNFDVSNPIGRESHHITICRELTNVFYDRTDTQRLNVSIQPGSGKSTLLCMFVAWAYAHYADCNFIYTSYAKDLATKNTFFIKTIMQSRMYSYLFDVHISRDTKAKDAFMTTAGGRVMAFGTDGQITGMDAGLQGVDRFSGALIIDDPLKPKDAASSTMRKKIIENYQGTMRPRPRGDRVPIINISQRTHEEDLTAFFLSGQDTRAWHDVTLPSLDEAGNALCPSVTSLDELQQLQEKSPYFFSAQYQQKPVPAGGAIFKRDWLLEHDEEPKMLTTFITADTAETSKTWNDATAFSFWGVYEIELYGAKTGEYALHWLDCLEIRVEPKDLESYFLDFFRDCCRHPVPPRLAYIEKKSTGVTLSSVLEKVQGLYVRKVERTSESGSKTARFLETQPYIAGKLVTLTRGAKHGELVKSHIESITANDTHRHDDIADTLADAVRVALIDKEVYYSSSDFESDMLPSHTDGMLF